MTSTTATPSETTVAALAECLHLHQAERLECTREPGHKGKHQHIRRGVVIHQWTNRRRS